MAVPERSNQQLHDEGVALAIRMLRVGGVEMGDRPVVKLVGDLVMLSREDGFTAGVRIRRVKFLDRYGFDVTLRMISHTSRIETDLVRARNWCDVYFYAFVNEAEAELKEFLCYHCIDVHAWYRRPGLIGEKRRGNRTQKTAGAIFLTIDLRYQPKEVILSSLEIPYRGGFL